MAEVRFLPPAARYIKKLKDKKLKTLYREAIDKICVNYFYTILNRKPRRRDALWLVRQLQKNMLCAC